MLYKVILPVFLLGKTHAMLAATWGRDRGQLAARSDQAQRPAGVPIDQPGDQVAYLPRASRCGRGSIHRRPVGNMCEYVVGAC
jgi:hypothetical protein